MVLVYIVRFMISRFFLYMSYSVNLQDFIYATSMFVLRRDKVGVWHGIK